MRIVFFNICELINVYAKLCKIEKDISSKAISDNNSATIFLCL